MTEAEARQLREDLAACRRRALAEDHHRRVAEEVLIDTVKDDPGDHYRVALYERALTIIQDEPSTPAMIREVARVSLARGRES